MTEAEWLACTDPVAMLQYLRINSRKMDRKVSERKLRLIACSCFACIRPLVTSSLAVEAVGVAERFADGNAKRNRRPLARQTLRQHSKVVTS